jgi:fibronectin type 3 domain-containing protein
MNRSVRGSAGRGRCLGRWVGAALVAGLTGCASDSQDAYFRNTTSSANVYVAPVATPISKVAIMPFRAPTELIGTSVSDLFVTEMLRAGRYELVERSQMAKVLSETELSMAGLSAAKAAEVGNLLGADGVIIGTVDEYATVAVKGKTLAVVGMTARLIDCRSGKVMWSVDLARRADESEQTLPRLARDVVHEMTAGLYQKWGVQRTVANVSAGQSVRADTGAPVVREHVAPPAAPKDFTLSDQGLREVTVTWSQIPAGASRLRVERSASSTGPFVVVTTVDADEGEYRDAGGKGGLADGTVYFYRLVSEGRDGQVSAPSRVQESMTAPPPDPPRRVRAVPHGSRAVQVEWDASPSEGVERYVVERASALEPDSWQRRGEVQGTLFHEGETPKSDLADAVAYLYRVQAVNRVGAVGAFSAPTQVMTEPPPAAVTGLSAQGDQVRCVPLSWQPSPEPDIVHYEVWRAEDAAGPFSLLATVKGRTSCCHLDGLADPGNLLDQHTYHYRVIAVDAVTARSAEGATVSATTRAVPPVVEGVVADSGRPREVPLRWALSPDEKVIGYVVARADSEDGVFAEVADVPGRETVAWTDKNGVKDARKLGRLADGATYRYQVTAYNTARARAPWSGIVEAATKRVPAAPWISAVSTGEPRRVTLQWQANAEPDVATYRIEWADAAGGRYREAGRVAAPGTSFVHLDQPDGAPRCYRLMAVDADTLESAWSEAVCGGTRPLPPAPADVRCAWEDGRAVLTWTAPDDRGVRSFRVARLGLMGLTSSALGDTEERRLALEAVQVGKGVRVFVTALDNDGLESPRSAVVEIRPPVAGGAGKEGMP